MNWEIVSAVASALCAMLGAFAGILAKSRAQAEAQARQQERLDWLVGAVGELKEDVQALRRSLQQMDRRVTQEELRRLPQPPLTEWMD